MYRHEAIALARKFKDEAGHAADPLPPWVVDAVLWAANHSLPKPTLQIPLTVPDFLKTDTVTGITPHQTYMLVRSTPPARTPVAWRASSSEGWKYTDSISHTEVLLGDWQPLYAE